ncbi:MAG: FAD-dependent oxidoreductase [Bryobacterales bacterium]|nr:FAD-dependent oxidoreductase [Bryobacterales bacterium]
MSEPTVPGPIRTCRSIGVAAPRLLGAGITLLALALYPQSPPPLPYDVIVVGAGAGGVAAALQAARMGSRVALIEDTDWVGGQMSSAGVSTMDEGHFFAANPTGIYREFLERATAVYSSRSKSVATCYWSPSSHCFEPLQVERTLRAMLHEQPNIDLYPLTTVSAVLLNGAAVTGVRLSSGRELGARVTMDATEAGDLLALAGAEYYAGNGAGSTPGSCIQDITYAAVIQRYDPLPAGLRFTEPPPGYVQARDEFRRTLARLPFNDPTRYPVSFQVHNQYRGLPDLNRPGSYTSLDAALITKAGVNWVNDFPTYSPYATDPLRRFLLPATFLTDPAMRDDLICQAKLKTLNLLYFIQDPGGLNQPDWSVSQDFAGSQAQRYCSIIPQSMKSIEALLPLRPYIRESRRIMAVHDLTINDIRRTPGPDGVPRGKSLPTAVALGDYFVDLHNCDSTPDLEPRFGETSSDTRGLDGPFQVPIESFIPKRLDGFLAAEKNLGYSRLASGALRLQPAVMSTGQAAGAIAALAAASRIQPRQVNPLLVQKALTASESAISLYVYSDVPFGSPYWPDVQLASSRGLMLGYSFSNFGVTGVITRREAALVLTRLLNLPTAQPAEGIFDDVPPTDPAATAIEAIYRRQITQGCSAAPLNFCPDATLSREQLAAFLARALQLPYAAITLADVSLKSPLYSSIAAVSARSIMEPCAPGLFCPGAPALRGGLARSLIRALSVLNGL